MKYRTVMLVSAVVLGSFVINSLPWEMQYLLLGLVACGLYTILRVPTLPDDAPRAPRTLVE